MPHTCCREDHINKRGGLIISSSDQSAPNQQIFDVRGGRRFSGKPTGCTTRVADVGVATNLAIKDVAVASDIIDTVALGKYIFLVGSFPPLLPLLWLTSPYPQLRLPTPSYVRYSSSMLLSHHSLLRHRYIVPFAGIAIAPAFLSAVGILNICSPVSPLPTGSILFALSSASKRISRYCQAGLGCRSIRTCWGEKSQGGHASSTESS